MPKLIQEMYAFIATEEDGDEGIPATPIGQMMMPLVGADLDRINSLRPDAVLIAAFTGLSIQLVRFSRAETLETF